MENICNTLDSKIDQTKEEIDNFIVHLLSCITSKHPESIHSMRDAAEEKTSVGIASSEALQIFGQSRIHDFIAGLKQPFHKVDDLLAASGIISRICVFAY